MLMPIMRGKREMKMATIMKMKDRTSENQG